MGCKAVWRGTRQAASWSASLTSRFPSPQRCLRRRQVRCLFVTTARRALDPEQRRNQTQAGSLLGCLTQGKGKPPYRYAPTGKALLDGTHHPS